MFIKCPKIPGSGGQSVDTIFGLWDLTGFLDACSNNGPPKGLDLAGFVNQISSQYISTLGDFGDENNPCNKWYKDVVKTIKEAAEGNCKNCPKLGAILGGRGIKNSSKCLQLIEEKGISPAFSFELFSGHVSDLCRKLCNLKKRSCPCP